MKNNVDNIIGCPSSKKRYETEDDARWMARDGMLFRDTPQLDVYYCLLCNGFHLTSSVKEKKDKRNSRRKK